MHSKAYAKAREHTFHSICLLSLSFDLNRFPSSQRYEFFEQFLQWFALSEKDQNLVVGGFRRGMLHNALSYTQVSSYS